ncbi:putative reverse transcriptase domain-containing protein, partial [Tanacetum coccineum]
SEASKDLKAPTEWLRGLERHFEQRDDGEIYFFDRIWIPSVGGVRKLIMDEAHTSRYSVHPGADKMYYDLRDLYWWPGIKRDIAEYVSRCLTCSKIKAEHQKPLGFLQQPEIPEWKWEKITMDFVTKLPKSSSGHDTIRVVVDRLTKSANFLPIREGYKTEKLAKIYTNEIVARHVRVKRTIQMLEDTASRHAFNGFWWQLGYSSSIDWDVAQKSYPDKRQGNPLEFHVETRGLLKVSPWKGVVRFGKKGKLAPRYVGPFEIVERVGLPDVQVPLDEIEIDENLRFVEEPIEIVERDVKKLKQRRIPLVKVRWLENSQGAGILGNS